MIYVVIVLIVLVLLVGGWAVAKYNGLVGLRNKVEGAFAQIDVQLNRRHDLIPNLVETVKGYASHEKEALEAVIRARNMAVDASTIQDQATSENLLSGALKSLFAVSEAYPELKANQNFLDLQAELSETEDRIAYARQYYNDIVRGYNTAIEQFPGVVIARMFSFEDAEYFEADVQSRTAPEVSFDS